MKIARVSTAVIEANYDYTFIRIETDRDGLFGTGESFPAPGLTSIISEMSPLLQGHDPREILRLTRHIARKASGAGSTSGIVWNAISGIEAALHDLVGKFYGCPVYQLLGGKVREEVRIYADCHAGSNLESWTPLLEPRYPTLMKSASGQQSREDYDPQACTRRAREMVAEGYDALKFDLDSMVVLTGDEMHRPLTNAEVRRMSEIVRATREAVGPSVDHAFDCHWRFRPSDAIRIGKAIEPYGVFWLEDPCPPGNWRQTAAVKRACGVPILTGENLVLSHSFLPLLENQAIDLVAPDVQKCGGLLEAKRIADLADLYGVGCAPHCIASPLGFMASVHVCAAVSNFTALEFHGYDVPFWNDVVGKEPIIRNGRVTVTDRPGISVELDEEVAREYRKPDEPWFTEQ